MKTRTRRSTPPSQCKKHEKTGYTKPGGGFAPGNPGRPKGAVSPNVQLARRIVAEDSEKLMKKAVELALKGNIPLIKLFADKLLGKRLDSGITVPVSKSPVTMTKALLRSLQRDGITPDDAAGLAQIIGLHLKAIELDDLAMRIKALETAASE